MSGDFQNVHIRVNDAATGKPTPVRIRFTDPDGKYYAPFGRLTTFGIGPGEDVGGNLECGNHKFAYINGTCEIRLPVGQVSVEIHKGPEFHPVFETVSLLKGKLALRYTIERWINCREKGWYSGDTHCFHLSPHAALLEGAGEDLAVVNLLATPAVLPGHYEKEVPVLSNILAFSGQEPALEMPGHMVVVNTLNRHRRLGELALLNCHRPVFPLTFGPPDGIDDWNLADWCEQCHRKKGLVVAFGFFEDYPNAAGEILADIVLDHVDAVDIDGLDLAKPDLLENWYQLLQCGLRLPLCAGSGKASNEELLGHLRTYVKLNKDDELNYKNWIQALRAGRCYVSNGPLVKFAVNKRGPGEVLKLASDDGKMQLQAEAEGLTPFGALEVIYNGNVIARAAGESIDDRYFARIDDELPVQNSGWLSARSVLANDGQNANQPFAHTSPIYVEIENQPFQPDAKLIQWLINNLEVNHSEAIANGSFENQHQRDRMSAVYQEAIARF